MFYLAVNWSILVRTDSSVTMSAIFKISTPHAAFEIFLPSRKSTRGELSLLKSDRSHAGGHSCWIEVAGQNSLRSFYQLPHTSTCNKGNMWEPNMSLLQRIEKSPIYSFVIIIICQLQSNDKSKCALSVSLTSSRQNCELTKDFTFIFLSQHVSRTGLLFTWWFLKEWQKLSNKQRM